MVVDEEPSAMRRTQDREKGRKPYAKPIAKRVHLKPEEAVLGFCKTAGYSVLAARARRPLCSADGS
jgi:hypothetical protein